MSQLEQVSIPVLTDLIRGRKRLEELDRPTSLIIGRWATKTAYMLNSSANFPIKVPRNHLWQLFQQPSKLPWGVVVVGAHSQFTEFSWCQSTMWQLCGPDKLTAPIADLINERTYKIGLHFGHLVLLTVWHSIPKWLFMLWTDLHTGVWPWKGKCGWHFDSRVILDSTPADMAVHVHGNAIKLVHHRYLAPGNGGSLN
ncbi:MAG TPA: hypothetical protein VGK24_07080 [Candidatus Angelobacter sp.]|jgi:hypothetical protein